MGLFDLFGKEPDVKNQRASRGIFGDPTTEGKEAPIAVFKPESYKEVESIIDTLRQGKNAIVHLYALKTDTAIRVLDILSGAIYALGGGVYEMGKNIFMFSPSGIEIKR